MTELEQAAQAVIDNWEDGDLASAVNMLEDALLNKRGTNVSCVMNMMEYSAYGAIAQLVIMTAIEKYCLIACEERLPENSLINPDAWQGAAKEIIEKLNKHYRRNQ